MGWELHIVRSEHWFDSHEHPIRSDEWLDLVNKDDELSTEPKNGEFYAIWTGVNENNVSWLEWCDGRITTKQPDQALYCKMLQIAKRLNARILDEDDRPYVLPNVLMNHLGLFPFLMIVNNIVLSLNAYGLS
ncbi:hypothetical protein [Citrobacter koseri]|uniref:hypothetical protein n=1 Tax=Citrobacter koseri TaxID=545 RepID=UPI003891AC47